MNTLTRWLVVLFLLGVIGIIYAQFPDAMGSLKGYHEEISILAKVISIGAAVITVLIWLFSKEPDSTDKGSGSSVEITVGRDLVGGDKYEEHNYHAGDSTADKNNR